MYICYIYLINFPIKYRRESKYHRIQFHVHRKVEVLPMTVHKVLNPVMCETRSLVEFIVKFISSITNTNIHIFITRQEESYKLKCKP